ncbi:MAG: hypothetical protein ABI461_15410 [Polyangiaceae bacterium]
MIQKGEDTKGMPGLIDQGDYFCANGVVTIGGPGCNQTVDLNVGSFQRDGGK